MWAVKGIQEANASTSFELLQMQCLWVFHTLQVFPPSGVLLLHAQSLVPLAEPPLYKVRVYTDWPIIGVMGV